LEIIAADLARRYGNLSDVMAWRNEEVTGMAQMVGYLAKYEAPSSNPKEVIVFGIIFKSRLDMTDL
jgi:hypothetical protein